MRSRARQQALLATPGQPPSDHHDGLARHKEPIPEAAVSTVRAATVEEIRPDTPERYSATISPATQIDLGFKSAGVIEEILQVKGADGRVLRDIQAPEIRDG